MENAIIIDDLCYQNLWDGLSMAFKRNTITAVSGPNNCGKTTLIRILNREIIVEDDIEIYRYPMNCFSIEEFEKYISCIIPLEKIPLEDTTEEEMYQIKDNKKDIEFILKGLKMKKISTKKISELSKKDFIYYQIATALINEPKILLLDSLDSILSEEEVMDIISFIREYQKERDLTVVMTTLNLKISLLCDYLYVIDEKKVKLKGKPLEVLEKDNILNKIGLNLPFIIDLSVKLKDYELIEEIECNQDRIIDELWK